MLYKLETHCNLVMDFVIASTNTNSDQFDHRK